MSPLPLLLILLAAPATAAEYVPPPPDGPGCRRALDLLDKLAGREQGELASGIGFHVQETGPDRGLFILRERAGTASFTALPGHVNRNLAYEVRREDGTPVYVEFRFEDGAYRSMVAGPAPFSRSNLVDSTYDEATTRRLTRLRLGESDRTFVRAHARARELDGRERLPLEESGRVLACPSDVWAAAINLCAEPQWSQVTAALSESYCQNHVCLGRDHPRRVIYQNADRCDRGPTGKGDRLDRHEPR